jgi:hypothetical protein
MHEPQQIQGWTRQKSDGCDIHSFVRLVRTEMKMLWLKQTTAGALQVLMHGFLDVESCADTRTSVTCEQMCSCIGFDALGQRQRHSSCLCCIDCA